MPFPGLLLAFWALLALAAVTLPCAPGAFGQAGGEAAQRERCRELVEIGRRHGLTHEQWEELVRLCEEQEGMWHLKAARPEDVDHHELPSSVTRLWYPKPSQSMDSEAGKAWRERIAESDRLCEEQQRQQQEELERLFELGPYREAHRDSEQVHDDCECWKLKVRAIYDGGETIFDSGTRDAPRQIPSKDLESMMGMGKQNPDGARYRYRDHATNGKTCCDLSYATNFVQIVIYLPNGDSSPPKRLGQDVRCPVPGRNPQRSVDYYITQYLSLSSTPPHFKGPEVALVRDGSGVGVQELPPKSEAWAGDLILRPGDRMPFVGRLSPGRREAKPGLGKVEMIVNGKLCETIWFRYSDL